MKNRNLALLAALAATSIYGINYSIAKDVMDKFIEPYGFIVLRVVGATTIFWILGLFGPKEKISKKDWWRLLCCGLFGMSLNMISFFKGLNETNPIEASIITANTPIAVLILGFFFYRERITKTKSLGILIGLGGTLILVLYGSSNVNLQEGTLIGNIFVFFNVIFYGLYIVIAKGLAEKYHPFTYIKWLCTIGCVIVLPIGIPQLLEVNLDLLDSEIVYKIIIVVVGASVLTYLFNLYALKHLKPSTLSIFIYLQPLIAMIYSIMMGRDSLNTFKITMGLIILLGVYLTTLNPKTKNS